MTAYAFKIVLFLFLSGSQPLVNTVELKLWKEEGRKLDFGVITVLLSLMDEHSRLWQ